MDRVTKTVELFGQGYMCSQAVFAAFSEDYGVTEKQALQIGACFGSGMNKGEVCGACTGALMALGMRYGQFDLSDVESRAAQKAKAVRFLEEKTFTPSCSGENKGSSLSLLPTFPSLSPLFCCLKAEGETLYPG